MQLDNDTSVSTNHTQIYIHIYLSYRAIIGFCGRFSATSSALGITRLFLPIYVCSIDEL